MRRLWRGFQIFWVILRFGLDELLLSSIPHPIAQTWAHWARRLRHLHAPRGERLRLALEQLGPIFIKFGQVLSTRRDILPPDIARELAKLQDRVPPFDARIAIATIEQQLGQPLDAIFETFDPIPVASASIAQVHFATLRQAPHAKRPVAVKVLRPHMQPIIEKDLRLLHTFARWIEAFSTDGKRLKPQEVVAEFDKYLHDELDLVREAANAAQLRRNMAALPLVLIPEMVWDYCRQSVMVMARMEGIPINQVDKLRAAGVNIQRLAQDGITLFFTQVFCDGFFHADMHPGNIMVSTQPEQLGRYILLDFGIVGTLTEYDKGYLAHNFTAFFRRDYKRVAELHIESGWVPSNTRVDELEAAVRAVCEPYFDRPLRDISLGMVLMRLFQASRRFNVEIQPQLVLLQKTLLNIEGLGRDLDPDLDLWQTAKPFLEKWMKHEIGPGKFLERLRQESPKFNVIFPALPRLLYDALHPSQASSSPLHEQLQILIQEQRHTRRLLQTLLWLTVGLGVGAVFSPIVLRWLQGLRWFF